MHFFRRRRASEPLNNELEGIRERVQSLREQVGEGHQDLAHLFAMIGEVDRLGAARPIEPRREDQPGANDTTSSTEQ